MEFANKEYLFLLLLLIPYIIWYMMYRKKTEPTMRMSDTFAFRYAPKSWKVRNGRFYVHAGRGFETQSY